MNKTNKNYNISNSEESTNRNKVVEKKQPPILLIVLLLIIALACIVGGAYARYKTRVTGTISATAARARCSMVVQTCDEIDPTATSSREVVNPYCVVTVKNYDENDVVSQTDLKFKVTVTAAEGETLPEYYWIDENDRILAHSTDLVAKIGAQTNATTQSLSADNLPEDFESESLPYTTKVEKNYRIVFVNPGKSTFSTQQVHFDLSAIQADEN